MRSVSCKRCLLCIWKICPTFFVYRVSQVSSILGLYFEKPCALTTELNNLRGKAASHRNKTFDEYNLRGEKRDVVNLKSNKYTSFGEIMDEVNFYNKYLHN